MRSAVGWKRPEKSALGAGAVILILAAALLMGSVGASAAADNYPLGKPVIKFAGQDICSGRFGDYGRMMIMGSEMARDEINAAGGIMGSKVETNFMDDEFNVSNNIKYARYQVKEWGADFMFGFTLDAGVIALSDILGELDTLLITCHSADPRLVQEVVFQKHNKRLFRGVNGYEQDAVLPALYLKDRTDIKTWANMAADYGYGWDCGKMLEKAFAKHRPDIKKVAEVGCPDGAVDYIPQIRKIMAAKPNMIFATPWAGDGTMNIRQALMTGLFEQDWFKVWWQPMGGSIDMAEGLTEDVRAGKFKESFLAAAVIFGMRTNFRKM